MSKIEEYHMLFELEEPPNAMKKARIYECLSSYREFPTITCYVHPRTHAGILRVQFSQRIQFQFSNVKVLKSLLNQYDLYRRVKMIEKVDISFEENFMFVRFWIKELRIS